MNESKNIQSIQFEKDTCGRCGGTGSMPYAAYGGACFACNRRGTVLTAKGRAASRKTSAWKEANLTVPATSLKAGDRVIVTNMRGAHVTVTVESIEPSSQVVLYGGVPEARIDVNTVDSKGNQTSRGMAQNATMMRATTQEDLQALAAHLSRNSGAIITYKA